MFYLFEYIVQNCCKTIACASNLTLTAAAERVSELSSGLADYAVASPDLWNRRQDSGKSGFEIMQAVEGMPPMRPAS